MDSTVKRKPGRPRTNLEGKGDGNPMLAIRLDPADLRKVKALGGAPWARKILLEALREGEQQSENAAVSPPIAMVFRAGSGEV